MNLGLSESAKKLLAVAQEMIREEIIPRDEEFLAEVDKGDRWQFTDRQIQILDQLKASAQSHGLWNLWHTDGPGGALNTVEYAYFAEEMGKSHLAPEVFNCNAPDTGNMEVLTKFATDEIKAAWLQPLLDGKIRSAYLMTEPQVASSDATNISMSCVRQGDHYVLNGEKWWATGAGDPRCQLYLVMVQTDKDGARYAQHSMIIVPAETAGIDILRPMTIYGSDDAPHGHMHIRFRDVRVPSQNLLVGEGHGFKIAQSRLGPGRIHHCMRAIGQAEKSLELLCQRSLSRQAFGQSLARLGGNLDIVAQSRIDIEATRLLCLKTAWLMDQGDQRAAAPWISMVKTQAPKIALKVTDEAIQMHGGAGISQDTPLARQWLHLRTLRLADGPDAVHLRQVARAELRQYDQ